MQRRGRATVRRLPPVKGGEGAYPASMALPSAEGRRGDPKVQALPGSSVHPLAPRNGGPAASLWPRQAGRGTAVLLCPPLASGEARGARPCSRKPLREQGPQPASPGQWGAGACWQPAGGHRRRSLVAQGAGRPARMEVLGEWVFSVPGTALKGKECYQVVEGRAPKQQTPSS